jgi:hypothetical protein
MGTIDAAELPPRPCIEDYAGWLTMATALLMLIGFFVTVHSRYNWVLGVAAVSFLLSSAVLFTRSLGDIHSDPGRMNAIFRYAYGFIFTVLLLGAVGMFQPELFTVDPQNAKDEANKDPAKQTGEGEKTCQSERQKAQRNEKVDCQDEPEREPPIWIPTSIAIVPGCDFSATAEPTSDERKAAASLPSAQVTERERQPNDAMPGGAHCGDLPPQWVISIGGSVLSCHFDGSCPKRLAPEFEDGIEARLADQRRQIKRAEDEIASLEKEMRIARTVASMGLPPSGDSLSSLNDQRNKQRDNLQTLRKDEADLSRKADAAREWDVVARNIEGAPIIGGLVVPVYFVVLAVLGSLISMLRKIPEYQYRVEPHYPEEFKELAKEDGDAKPPLSRPRARDYIVFQILQVVFAPAIALVAFSWARPEQVATTAILAFAAGFSSEVFLVAIRAVAEQAINLGPRMARARALAAAGVTRVDDRGALPPQGPETSGGLKVGDNVTLSKPVGEAMPGAKGVVLSIDAGGQLIVKLTEDNTGMPAAILLRAAPPDSFTRTSEDPQQPEGPAG